MYTHLNHHEREQIAILRAQRLKSSEIGARLRRDPSTIRRELIRLGPRTPYSPLRAQHDARKKRSIPRTKKKLADGALWTVVHEKLRMQWSPEQIAHHLKKTYPNTTMHVSHETIYTYLYTLPRGALRKELSTTAAGCTRSAESQTRHRSSWTTPQHAQYS